VPSRRESVVVRRSIENRKSQIENEDKSAFRVVSSFPQELRHSGTQALPFPIPRWEDFEPWTLNLEPPLLLGIMIRALTVQKILDEEIAKKLA
jgi:hypothetical protein